jgi:hypothetical protein
MPEINKRGGDNLNPKLQKILREIERAKAKIAELQAALPALEKQKSELENAEIIKVFRSADVAPGDFAAFIEAYKAKEGNGAPLSGRYAPQPNTMEDRDNEED